MCAQPVRVTVRGLLYRHERVHGGRCRGSGRPLFGPAGRRSDESLVGAVTGTNGRSRVTASMSTDRSRPRLAMTVAAAHRGQVQEITALLEVEEVRRLVADVDAWLVAAAAPPLPTPSAGAGTGPDRRYLDWCAGLPRIPGVRAHDAATDLAAFPGPDGPWLFVGIERLRGPVGFAAVGLAVPQLCALLDGLRSWLHWVDFLVGSGLCGSTGEGGSR